MAYTMHFKISYPAYTDLKEGARGHRFYIENSTKRIFEIMPNGAHVPKGKLEDKVEEPSGRYVIK